MKKKSIFRILLKEHYVELPELIQNFHDEFDQIWQGEIERNTDQTWCASMMCKLLKLPQPKHKDPVTIMVSHNEHKEEIWRRQIGETIFTTYLGREGELMYEKMGPIKIYFKLKSSPKKLIWNVHKTTILGIRLPKILMPKTIAEESINNGYYHFRAKVTVPFIGSIVDYQGTLDRTDNSGENA